tara:strand:+ start:8320 stop:8535 length:216 start_codon:yes stop_codon:yes gene_type:complete
MTTYNGYQIEPAPANRRPVHYYSGKANGYLKIAIGLERRAKRAGRDSAEYKRYMKLLNTYLKYNELAKSAK